MLDVSPCRRVMVAGGGGFLGQAIVRTREVGVGDQSFVPRSRDDNLRTKDGIDRALADGNFAPVADTVGRAKVAGIHRPRLTAAPL